MTTHSLFAALLLATVGVTGCATSGSSAPNAAPPSVAASVTACDDVMATAAKIAPAFLKVDVGTASVSATINALQQASVGITAAAKTADGNLHEDLTNVAGDFSAAHDDLASSGSFKDSVVVADFKTIRADIDVLRTDCPS